jgi:hypothetical protein
MTPEREEFIRKSIQESHWNRALFSADPVRELLNEIDSLREKLECIKRDLHAARVCFDEDISFGALTYIRKSLDRIDR